MITENSSYFRRNLETLKMYSISNSKLVITVIPLGAELQSIFNKENSLEYLWDAGPEWPKKSPVLFPIVGGLKNGRYSFEDKEYEMSRHGFARDMVFNIREHTEDSIVLFFESDRATRIKYPFDFKFLVTYKVYDQTLNISYRVENTGARGMFFSVGGHPAFRVPIGGKTNYEDYRLEFEEDEEAGRWPLSAEGLLLETPLSFLSGRVVPLAKDLFSKDALVFKQLNSKAVSILSDKHANGLKVSFPGFPYLGIWAAKNADFVCIEPWCGVADGVNATGEIMEKEGINRLEAGTFFERTFSVTVF